MINKEKSCLFKAVGDHMRDMGVQKYHDVAYYQLQNPQWNIDHHYVSLKEMEIAVEAYMNQLPPYQLFRLYMQYGAHLEAMNGKI